MPEQDQGRNYMLMQDRGSETTCREDLRLDVWDPVHETFKPVPVTHHT